LINEVKADDVSAFLWDRIHRDTAGLAFKGQSAYHLGLPWVNGKPAPPLAP
jgi:hypothetical protein